MEPVIVAAVADVRTWDESPERAFEHVLTPLRRADLRFAQLERIYSERGDLQEQAGGASWNARQHPGKAAALKSVPFDVVSIASNLTGHLGPDPVEDTAAALQSLGISTIGAGRNIEAARKPATFDIKGLRIAFLGYVSVILPQCWATETRAGAAPMRAHTFYEPYEFQPGCPARIVTIPHEADLEHMVNDIKQARQNADLVFASFHWGVHFQPRPCDYQTTVAHAAIDAGANVILGHHPHQPQGIELYRDGVIFYSIGNFSFPPRKGRKPALCLPQGEFTHEEVYKIEPDPGVEYGIHRHYPEGGIVYVEGDKTGLRKVTYLPTLMNADGQPEVVRPDQPQFEKALTYLNWAGKFIQGGGGLTQMKPVGDRYEVFSRPGA